MRGSVVPLRDPGPISTGGSKDSSGYCMVVDHDG